METIIKTKLEDLLQTNNKGLLSLYYTMGYPAIEDIYTVFKSIDQTNKVDFVELGMPYSDPLADGETIQKSSDIAIKNGMTFSKYFDHAKAIRKITGIPLIFMGYYNQIYQYGIERFCERCKDVGIEGIIIPDLPVEILESKYYNIFKHNGLLINLLITPTTPDERIRKIERLTTGFIYAVSGNSITGKKGEISKTQLDYFRRISSLKLSKPVIIGFGIHDSETYSKVCEYANGAIIGSEFIRILSRGNLNKSIPDFIHTIKK